MQAPATLPRTLLLALLVTAASANAATTAVGVRPVDGQCAITYPHDSMRAGETGNVKLHIEIGADGVVTGTRVLSSSGFERLDRETRSQVEACRYTSPKDASGASTTASLDVDYNWKLDPSPVPPPAAVTEEMIRAEYDRVKASLPRQEYHVRHVMTATREQAVTALQRLRAGESWAVVAHEMSKDNGSSEKAGDLGWAPARTFTPPFADALPGIAPHGITAEPVQTQFGWHVIEVIETRDMPFPPYADVHDRIADALRKKSGS